MIRNSILTILILLTFPSFSNNNYNKFLNYLSREERGELITKGFLYSEGLELNDLKYFPPYLEIKSEFNVDFEPNLALEYLFVIENNLLNLKREEQYLIVANILRALSDLKGAMYFSPSRQNYRILFKDFYRIDNLESDERVENLYAKSYKQADKVFARQEDLTFGVSKHTINYDFKEHSSYPSLFFRMQLETTLKKLWFTIVSPKDLVLISNIFLVDDKIFIYFATLGKTIRGFGMDKKRFSSFSARVSALYEHINKTLKAISP